VVTSPDAFTGENFRRGGFLDPGDRYLRAAEFVQAARELWESWGAAGTGCGTGGGADVGGTGGPGSFCHKGLNFDVEGHFTVPRSPQVHPVILQAGDSGGGREFAAHSADAIFTRHSTFDAGRAFYADVKDRLARYGRSPGSLKVLPGSTFILGDTEEDALEHARHVRRQQVSPQTAILLLEQLWNTDLSALDPDGPLPDFDPVVDAESIIKGRTRLFDDPVATARQWRALAEEKKLSVRDLIIEVTGRVNFVGTPARIAAEINRYVQEDACDGFILVPHLIPAGLDSFVATVVPLLQERGVLRASYEAGATLRDNMGLGPARPAGDWEAARSAAVAKESASA
jgi:alkanesulfonate monooxygenase SsuD/methylene tetrahydromethanopterin reductase-like flavin-dependent oxidoreductase (luciferase family)